MNLAIAVLSGIGAIQGLLFAVLILLKKQKKRYDWILCIWFLVFSLHLSLKFGFEFNAVELSDILIMTLGFLHGPFFWMYARAIVAKGEYPKDLVHFIPFVLFLVGSFVVGDVHNPKWEMSILIPKLLVLTVYPLMVLRLIGNREEGKKSSNPAVLAPHYLWIKAAAYIFLISMGISVIRLSIELLVGVSYFVFWDVLRYVLLVMVMGFFGLKYGTVYRPEEIRPAPKRLKYQYSPLSEKKMGDIRRTIEHFFQENSAYLNPKFSLSQLSQATKIPNHHLSQVINLKMNTKFYELVNSKRIDYAVELMSGKDQIDLTLEGLGYECGFNSKSVFFENFKKYTGKTPGDFRKQISSD
ncbi:MAG: helix-turn-helix domain-containing protein [Bacteroidota bacterium]